MASAAWMSSGRSISPWSEVMADPRTSPEMPEPSQPDQILDAELKAWVEGEGDDQREFLVEARVPKRTVTLGNSPSGRVLPREVETSKNVDRNSLLEELQHDLDELLGTRTNLLRSAGAVAVRANREQLRHITRHPLVRAVRSNRRLKPGNVAG